MNDQDIIKRLTEIAELATALSTEIGQEPKGEPDPYQGALDYRFSATYNGNLTAEDLDYQRKLWVDWVLENKPETKELYLARMEGQHRPPTVWVGRGGLQVQSLSPAFKAYNQITHDAYLLAARRALALREAAGWTGPNFLTSPGGRQKTRSGQYFGPFTRPEDVSDDVDERLIPE